MFPVNEKLERAGPGPGPDLGDVEPELDDLNLDEKLLKSDRVLPPEEPFCPDFSSASCGDVVDDTRLVETAEEVLPRLLGATASGFNVPNSDVDDERIRPNFDFPFPADAACLSGGSPSPFGAESGGLEPCFAVS